MLYASQCRCKPAAGFEAIHFMEAAVLQHTVPLPCCSRTSYVCSATIRLAVNQRRYWVSKHKALKPGHVEEGVEEALSTNIIALPL